MSNSESKPSNITADGQVLYLDAASLENKVDRSVSVGRKSPQSVG